MRLHRVVLATAVALTLCGCSGPNTGSGSGNEPATGQDADASTGRSIDLGDQRALEWGTGAYGVVLAHGAAFDAASWEAQATAIAEQDATVVAVEDISPEGIAAAVTYLKDKGVDDVALVGGSAGADGILQLAAQQPALPDQLILLSANGVIEGLGTEPKLFIVSRDEPVADVSQTLADNGPGEENTALILDGSAHAQNMFDAPVAGQVLQAVLDRVQEFSTS